MSEWINIKNQLPPKGIKIKIRAKYHDDEFVEAEAVFNIYDIDQDHEAWSWSMSKETAEKYGTLRPTHWMPLPLEAKEK